MLVAEAVRLAAIEVLCPTSALEADSGYPTLAGRRVLDSRELQIDELLPGDAYTPVLALYTGSAEGENRAGVAAGTDFDNTCILEVVGELAVVANDENGEYVDAMAESDPDARLVLAAMMAQVRFILEEAQEGLLFRRFCKSVLKVTEEPFAVPGLNLRWQRTTASFTCAVGQDSFDPVTGHPAALEQLAELLPENSYAAAKIAKLIDSYKTPENPPLVTPDVIAGAEPDTITDPREPSP